MSSIAEEVKQAVDAELKEYGRRYSRKFTIAGLILAIIPILCTAAVWTFGGGKVVENVETNTARVSSMEKKVDANSAAVSSIPGISQKIDTNYAQLGESIRRLERRQDEVYRILIREFPAAQPARQ